MKVLKKNEVGEIESIEVLKDLAKQGRIGGMHHILMLKQLISLEDKEDICRILQDLSAPIKMCKGAKGDGCNSLLCNWYFPFSEYSPDKMHPYCSFCLAEEEGKEVDYVYIRVKKSIYNKKMRGEYKQPNTPKVKVHIREAMGLGWLHCEGPCSLWKPQDKFRVATMYPTGRHPKCKKCQDHKYKPEDIEKFHAEPTEKDLRQIEKSKNREIRNPALQYRPGQIWCHTGRHWTEPEEIVPNSPPGKSKICYGCNEDK